MIYLDNSATTKPCKEAVAAVVEAMEAGWGNTSSLYAFGIEAARNLRNWRSQVASAMGAEPDRVFFTSGGTEADNWALLSSAKRFGKKNKHIITTAIEHHAILHAMQELASGFSACADSLWRSLWRWQHCIWPPRIWQDFLRKSVLTCWQPASMSI